MQPLTFELLDLESPQEILTETGEVVDWSVHAIGADAAWQRSRGEGIKVAVLDTGFPRHPDLPNVAIRYGEPDTVGHGTHVAGIIGAIDNEIGVVGVAPGCTLFCRKVLPGHQDAVIEGIRWAVAEGADVINMSWGAHKDDPDVHQAIKDAYEAGVVLVAAIGNTFKAGEDTIAWPARYPEVIGVAALDRGLHKAVFSAAGPEMANNVALPGVDVLSCWLDGQYARLSGTSMAAPMLSGMLALYLAHRRPQKNLYLHEWVRLELQRITILAGDFHYTGMGLPDAGKL